MKLRLLFFLLAGGLLFTLPAQNGVIMKAKLSPVTQRYVLQYKALKETGELPKDFIYKKFNNGIIYTGALVKVQDEVAAATGIKAIDGVISTKAGDIWSVKIPADKVEAFTQVEGISYIQVDEPAFPSMDIVRKTTRTDSVHSGIGLPMPYAGKNVVVGIIDFGFDYNHPAFFDTLGTTYRVRKVWELNTNGTPPKDFPYGHELKDSTSIMAQGTDNSLQTHGTGVAGVAAGSGAGSWIGATANTKARGIAYESDLVFVGVRRDSIGAQWMQGGFSDFVDGIHYIFKYAVSVYKPAVVNISWGSQSGPHDGTSLFNQACNNLSGPGRIVVMSAGNDGEDEIHLAKTFTATDSLLPTFLTFSPSHYRRTWLDAWGEPGKTFCAEVTLYSKGVAGNKTATICIDDHTHTTNLMGSNGTDTCYIEYYTSASEFNNKPRMTINIFNKSTDSIGVIWKATDGQVHVWNEYYYYGFPNKFRCTFDAHGYPWAVSGNNTSTTSDMGSGESVLLVGAYASKVGFNNLSGNILSYAGYVSAGNIVPFSSRGPMVNGTVKPDITAPGLTLNTAYNSLDTAYVLGGTGASQLTRMYTHPVSGKKYYYGEFIGTSASGPVASGIVALMLQAHPYLTPKDVKKIIAETAIQDALTGVLPAQGNNNWGHGKINAYGALKASIQKAGMYNFSGKKIDCILYPNPNKGIFTLDHSAEHNEVLHIEVFHMNGSLLYQQDWTADAGENTTALDLSSLPKALYLVKVSSQEGFITIRTLVE